MECALHSIIKKIWWVQEGNQNMNDCRQSYLLGLFWFGPFLIYFSECKWKGWVVLPYSQDHIIHRFHLYNQAARSRSPRRDDKPSCIIWRIMYWGIIRQGNIFGRIGLSPGFSWPTSRNSHNYWTIIYLNDRFDIEKENTRLLHEHRGGTNGDMCYVCCDWGGGGGASRGEEIY